MGGQDRAALPEIAAAGQLQSLLGIAQQYDVLSALAVRCEAQGIGATELGDDQAGTLKQALLDNTLRNMKISAQALKLAAQLNQAGITPLFLKGTARLLSPHTGAIGFRKQADIDLIVQPAELNAAAEVLLADGYCFYRVPKNASAAPAKVPDAASAIEFGAAHHHLPPLAKSGYATTVELHRHFLPGRFQRHTALEPLFDSARTITGRGAAYRVPSTEYQLIHLVLGKLVHDGYLARRTFPIREACDFIDLVDDARDGVDEQLVVHHCGSDIALFAGLVADLMAYTTPQITLAGRDDVADYIRVMHRRFHSPVTGRLLDAYARLCHLMFSLAYSPAKLPAYLRRAISSN